MILIIDYGLGNIRSLMNWFKRADVAVTLSSDLDLIKSADALILPGVGAFRDAIKALEDQGMIGPIKDHVKAGKPLVGICLGMQLLFEASREYGYYEGLGFLKGKMIAFDSTKVKVPHMGWNNLKVTKELEAFKDDYVYFVHSYYGDQLENVIAYADYEVKVPAIVKKDNVLGFQFHPEKSGQVGERLLDYVKEFFNDYIPSN